jgi:hypothetical protein
MRETATYAIVGEQLERLLQAFPRRTGGQDLKTLTNVYYQGLQELEADALRASVDICIKNDQFFPKIARLREVAGEWMKRNRAAFSIGGQAKSWDTCHICGAKVESRPVIRQARDSNDSRRLLFDATGAPLMETLQAERYYITHNAQAHGVRPEADA